MATARALSFALRVKDVDQAVAAFRSVGEAADDPIYRGCGAGQAQVSTAAAGYGAMLPPWQDSAEIKTLLTAGEIGLEPYEAAAAARRAIVVCWVGCVTVCTCHRGS